MENPPQPADGSAGSKPDSSTAAEGSERTTPAGTWNGTAGQTPDEVSRLARAALQSTALFAGNAGAAAAQQAADAAAVAVSAGTMLDPLSGQQLTTDQLAAMLSTGGYTATALGALGGAAGMQADNAATLNALLLSGGLNLNTLAAAQNLQSLQLAGLADLSHLNHLMGGDPGDMDDGGGGGGKGGLNVTSNKQLSSRFRGVCWNKKNKRWQAAINSSGKYLYLGSFTNEDDAARQFDRAAIKLRGKKAKLNFEYADYVDENGELIDDIVLPQGAPGKDDMAGGRGSTGGIRRASKSSAACAADAAAAAQLAGLAGLDPADMFGHAALAASLMQQGALQASRGGKTAVLAAPLALEKEQVSVLLPTGCTLEFVLPVQDPATAGSSSDSGGSKTLFGVVYKDSNGLYGAGVWTGYMFKAFGLYSSDEAAAQTARCAGELLCEDRDLRCSGGVANQQSMGLMGPAALLGTPGAAAAAAAAAAAFPQDALALANLAAATGLQMGGAAGGGGGVNGRGGGGGGGGVNGGVSMGMLGMGAGGFMGAAGMGGLANVSLATAAQLAQQAAAEQGLPMSYPPLSVALPVVTSSLQLLPAGDAGGGGADPAAAAAAAVGGLEAAAAAAVAKASNEAEMQQMIAQLMAQQAPPQLGVGALPQQQQMLHLAGAGGAAAAAAAGGVDGGLKLANVDMSQLRAQVIEQQQQGGVAGGEAGGEQQQLGSAGAVGFEVAGGKRRLGEGDPTTGAGVGGSAGAAATTITTTLPAGMLVQSAGGTAAAAAGEGEGAPALKRIKVEGDAAAAGAAGVVPGGVGMAQIDLQDALKMLSSVQGQQ